MTASKRHRRAFSLLEVVFAAAIGSVVALAAVGLMVTLDRSDMKLSTRYREIAQLERAHTIMSRAFSSILAAEQRNTRSNRPRTPGIATGVNSATAPTSGTTVKRGNNNDSTPPTSTKGAATTSGSTASGSGSDPQAAGGGAAAQVPVDRNAKILDQPLRISLGNDQALSGLAMARPNNAAFASGEPQRFEIVLAASPVPQSSRASASIAPDQRSLFDSDENHTPMPESGGKAVRGVFELRPSTSENLPTYTTDGSVRSWTLWWRPLPRLQKSDDGTVKQVGGPPGPPVEVATDLAYCRWQVFEDRERKGDYGAVYFKDLPAYIEMEVMTTSGLWANWMFEVDWATGSESAGNQDTQGEDEEGDPAAAGNAGAPGNTDQPGSDK